MTVTPQSSREQEVMDAAWNAVAVASYAFAVANVAYDRELSAFQTIVHQASSHGLSLDDIAQAAGITAEQARSLYYDGEL